MNWEQLLTSQRLGSNSNEHKDDRSQFQRDYDRIIFSSPFRRLQNKTQVFPLPGSIFVHNRLTHSLEVASVGRSLGHIVSEHLLNEGKFSSSNPLISKIDSVVSAACLAHDLGNPPFGHSGEDTIANFFRNGNGGELKNQMEKEEFADLTHFDGNANAFRNLSHQFKGRREGGFALTYTTLASMVKYPYESVLATKQKFGFFQSEKTSYDEIANNLGIKVISDKPIKRVRHPLVYLVEAADDICYQVMDLEDSYKLKIFDYQTTKDIFFNFLDTPDNKHRIREIENNFKIVTDNNERISYLRASVISLLINSCSEVFIENEESILSGTFTQSLIDSTAPHILEKCEELRQFSIEKIYNNPSVVEVEILGHRVIKTLLNEFFYAVTNPRQLDSKKLLSLIPEQYTPSSESAYHKSQSILDYITGMTDVYAFELYRKLTGIDLPKV
ncbi:MAG: deoxyguanosinetriphosphate triphosphohydrolase [Bacteroidales bacterium]